MSTTYQQLLRRYTAPALTLDEFRREWLPSYSSDKALLRAISQGRVQLRVTELNSSRYPRRVVYLRDLADWLDAQDPHNQPLTTPAANKAA